MASQMKQDIYTWDTGGVSYVEQMAGIEEGLRYIISLAELQARLSILPVYVVTATSISDIVGRNIEGFSGKPLDFSKRLSINPLRKIGDSWKKTSMSWWKMLIK